MYVLAFALGYVSYLGLRLVLLYSWSSSEFRICFFAGLLSFFGVLVLLMLESSAPLVSAGSKGWGQFHLALFFFGLCFFSILFFFFFLFCLSHQE